jgi:hypothetical protein
VKIIAAAGNDSRHELTPAGTARAAAAAEAHPQAHPQVKKLQYKAISEGSITEHKESLKRA